MFMTEFDEEKQRALDRRDGYEEGVEDGIGRGIEQGVKRAAERLRTAGYDEEIAQVVLGLNSDELLPPKPDGVHGSFITEYDEELLRAQDRSDGYRDGFANGVDEGKKQGIEQAANRLRAAGYDEEAIRVALGVTV